MANFVVYATYIGRENGRKSRMVECRCAEQSVQNDIPEISTSMTYSVIPPGLRQEHSTLY